MNAALIPAVAPYLIAPALVVGIVAGIGAWTGTPYGAESPIASRNPLQLLAALQMAAVFQLVILVVNAARAGFGAAGVLTTAAALGLTDVDALTMSMARDVGRTGAVDTAAAAIAIGILANVSLKTGIALVFGSSRFRMIVGTTLGFVVLSAVISFALAR